MMKFDVNYSVQRFPLRYFDSIMNKSENIPNNPTDSTFLGPIDLHSYYISDCNHYLSISVTQMSHRPILPHFMKSTDYPSLIQDLAIPECLH